MEKGTVVKDVTLEAPIDKVWHAITDKEEMKAWYFAIEEFIAKPGFQFKMYGEKKGVKFPISCTIKEVEQNKKLSYTWSYDDFPAETLLTFELNENGRQTELRLTHEGLERIPNESTDTSVENHRDGWEFIVGTSLKQYVEKETGN
ncbi:MAG TPA: SRPBCC domain-containing protein [Daejeonella sp.]|nr:SRPBCC domain-containing protein [Daejeonella sp.]